MIIEWKAIPGYEGLYEASSNGTVRSLTMPTTSGRAKRKTPKPLNQRDTRDDGYMTVVLYDSASNSKSFFVHNLIATTFIGPRPNGMECCHDDGNQSNNAASNLYWGTPAKNQQDRLRHGTDVRGTKHPKGKLSDERALEVKRRAIAGERTKDLALEYGVSPSLVSALKVGKLRPWLEI